MNVHEGLALQLFRLAYRASGAGIAIGIMEVLADAAGEPHVRVPFVTSIVLVMALPKSEPAQPRSIIGGHLISALAGLAVLLVLGPGETASAVAVGLATLAMMGLRVLHPPAGINAFLVTSQSLHWSWLLSSLLAGAVLLALFATAWSAGESSLVALALAKTGAREAS